MTEAWTPIERGVRYQGLCGWVIAEPAASRVSGEFLCTREDGHWGPHHTHFSYGLPLPIVEGWHIVRWEPDNIETCEGCTEWRAFFANRKVQA